LTNALHRVPRLWVLGSIAATLVAGARAAEPETIRIRAPQQETAAAAPSPGGGTAVHSEARRGFDYEAFTSRLEALWFQRKAFLAAGREVDAANQSELIRAFCAEEGVRNLDGPWGALLLEARRYLGEGSYSHALASLEFADFFAPGSSKVRFARAEILWKSGQGRMAAVGEALAAVRASVVEQWRDLVLLNHLILALLVSVLTCSTVFGVLMAFRYQGPLRHEIEERVHGVVGGTWAKTLGWATLLLPLVVWIGAGWAAIYWMVVTFRYLRRAERAVAMTLLVASACAVPMFRVTVALRGMAEDPIVRNTLASAGGAYEPERLVKLQRIVQAHPDEPTYRFLLAGMYKSGRYFEEAYEQYKEVLALDPGLDDAHLNIGNIFFQLGQHGEAVLHYRKVIDARPDSVLAYYNSYVAQSESFRFKEAQESLDKGSAADPEGMADLLYHSGRDGGRPMVVDATVDLGSLWQAALEGRPLRGIEGGSPASRSASGIWQLRGFLNPLSMFSFLAMAVCPLSLFVFGPGAAARACIRCGLPFCRLCRSDREKGREYCSQCLHLFVLGDGLAAETKTRKLYEIERHGKLSRRGKRITSLLLPGGAQLLRGRAARGCLLTLLWLVALTTWQPAALAIVGRVSGLDLRLDLLRPGELPATFAVDGVAILAVATAAVTWLAGNAWRRNPREA